MLPPSQPSPPPSRRAKGATPGASRRDRLTILRLMVLTACVALGLTLFGPRRQFDPAVADHWRQNFSAALLGLSLPGPFYALRGARRGTGTLLWLAQGIGVYLILPPAVLGLLLSGNDLEGLPLACLFYVMPLMSLWLLLAAVVGRRLTWRRWRRTLPWSERFGLGLGLAWSLLGLWILAEFYYEAFL